MENCCCHNSNVHTEDKPLRTTKKAATALPSMLLSIFIAFFPKCPVCWAVYMSMFGSIGLAKLPYMSWLLPVLLGFMGIHLFMLYRKVAQRGYLPFMVSLTGAVLLLTGRFYFPFDKWILLTGMGLIISGSLLNSLSFIRLPFMHSPIK
jgi:hypothetical protein